MAMSRKKTQGLTEREAEILAILWRRGESNVEDVRAQMKDKPTSNTVRMLLNIMRDRGLVIDDGKGYGKQYRAKDKRETTQVSALRKLIDTLFDGSAQELVVRLTDSGEVDAEQLKTLYERAKQAKKKA
jgi:predicted transcriptional regulator